MIYTRWLKLNISTEEGGGQEGERGGGGDGGDGGGGDDGGDVGGSDAGGGRKVEPRELGPRIVVKRFFHVIRRPENGVIAIDGGTKDTNLPVSFERASLRLFKIRPGWSCALKPKDGYMFPPPTRTGYAS